MTTLPEKTARELESLQQLANDIVARGLKAGADVAEAIARSGSELSVKVRLGEVELLEEASHRSIGLRVIKNQRVALTSTSDLSPSGISRFIQDAIDLVQISQPDEFAGPADANEITKDPFLDLELFDPNCALLDARQAIELAKRGEAAAQNFDTRIQNSDGASFGRTEGCFALALSGGFQGGYAGSFASLVVKPVANDGEEKKRRGFHYSAKRFFKDLDTPESVGEEAARRTLRKLGARKVATCEVPVIFDPDAARSLLGLLSGCLMGGSIWRRSSYLAEKENQPIASPLIQLVDNPHLKRGHGSKPFDGEGLATRSNILIENGVLRGFLCDSYSARKLKRRSTASASRGANGGVGASSSNLILQPGTTSPEELLQSTPNGLYVTEMMGFGFNAVTGDFSRGASGFWIENGKLAFPVSELTISLNFNELWKNIDAVGSDLDLRSSIASPSFRVAKMTVAGGD